MLDHGAKVRNQFYVLFMQDLSWAQPYSPQVSSLPPPLGNFSQWVPVLVDLLQQDKWRATINAVSARALAYTQDERRHERWRKSIGKIASQKCAPPRSP